MTKFDFYLANLSFRCPENISLEDLRKRAEQLSIDCEFIRTHNEKIFRHSSIYEEKLWEGYTISDLVHNYDLRNVLGNDCIKMLQMIIDRSAGTHLTIEELLELLDDHDETLVNGVLCLFEQKDLDQKYCVYNRNDWFDFHRYFLGLYPISRQNFTEKCIVFFPELHFQERISYFLGTLEGGFEIFSHTIIYCLTALNDKFKKHFNSQNVPNSLKIFSSICGIETSNEGNLSRKNDLSFSFLDDAEVERSIYCEPHMKLAKSDHLGDSKHYSNRIHFHPGRGDIASNRILIGYIGKHL